MKALFEGFAKNGNTERFCGTNHAQVPLKLTTFFTGLSHNVAALLAAKLADGILSYYMASSASGQYATNSVFWLATRAGKMERYCPQRTTRFVPANKISPKFKRVHESFLSPKLFSVTVKRFFVMYLSLWNQKKPSTRMKTKKTKCWWVLKIRFATKTPKFVLNLKNWIWILNLECKQSNDCIFYIFPIRI